MKYMNITKKGRGENTNDKSRFSKKILVGFALVGGLFLSAFLLKDSLANPISIVANIAQSDLKKTDERTNLLILGADNSDRLTDTILVASIDSANKDVVLISVPRDLWINVKTTKPYFAKINSVYKRDGIETLRSTLQDVLGIPIHYYGVLDFVVFKEMIDILGGVTVNVERSFVDNHYPIEGRETDLCGMPLEEFEERKHELSATDFGCRLQTISFNQGPQFMDSETALKYVRSRKGSNGEGTDFARAARQQNLLVSIKSELMSKRTLFSPTRLAELFNTYSTKVDSNLTLRELSAFYTLYDRGDIQNIKTLVLDDRSAPEQGGLLYEPEDKTLYGGQFVLVPKLGSFTQINAYVIKYLFE